MGKLRGQELEHSEKMNSKLLVVLVLVAAVSGQEGDFSCPDDFLGFYPHSYSCDKYWSCEDGLAELRTCGNGLAFIDTDESYKLEHSLILKTAASSGTVKMEKPTDTSVLLVWFLIRSLTGVCGLARFPSAAAVSLLSMTKAVNSSVHQ